MLLLFNIVKTSAANLSAASLRGVWLHNRIRTVCICQSKLSLSVCLSSSHHLKANVTVTSRRHTGFVPGTKQLRKHGTRYCTHALQHPCNQSSFFPHLLYFSPTFRDGCNPALISRTPLSLIKYNNQQWLKSTK